MSHALHAEWTKLRTLAGTWWLLARRGRAHHRGERGRGRAPSTARRTAAPCRQTGADPAKIGFTGVDLGQVVIALSPCSRSAASTAPA